MLFIDADGNGALSSSHEYVFTEWAAGSADDLDALRRAFDTNGDGKLTSEGAGRQSLEIDFASKLGSSKSLWRGAAIEVKHDGWH